MTPIPGVAQPTLTVVPGSSFQAAPVPHDFMIGQDTYNFAFMNVAGCVQGGMTTFHNNVPPPAGTAGIADIYVTALYLAPGGVGDQAGAIIDAYDENTGNFVDDLFVTVSPDSGTTLTDTANNEGWVASNVRTEQVTAYPSIITDGALFHYWNKLGTGTLDDTVSGTLLTVARTTSLYAFAYYRTPSKIFNKEGKEFKEFFKEHKEFFKEGKDYNDGIKNSPDVVIGPGPVEDELRNLIEKVASLEAKVLGQSYIKAEDRPAVGKAIAKAPAKTAQAKKTVSKKSNKK
jgi:hypothetical protein